MHNCNETTLIPGRYDLADAEHVCIKCKTPMRLAHPHGLLREELWPGSAGKRSQYMFDQDMFLFFDLLQKNMPGVSESGFIRTLEMFSQSKGRVSCFYMLIRIR